MYDIQELPVMTGKEAITVTMRALSLIDERLIDHGERVAYIISGMLAHTDRYTETEKRDICILALFHDIGAYKTEEIDKMTEFETTAVMQHSIYGYLFLKYLSPVSRHSRAVLYHHVRYAGEDHDPDRDIGGMMHLADRLDILLQSDDANSALRKLDAAANGVFAPEHIALLKQAAKNPEFCRILTSGERMPFEKLKTAGESLDMREIHDYLSMIIHAIDFRSPVTVTHTITTVAISVELARVLGYTDFEAAQVYYGALLHDIGKIAIPVEILENPGQLEPEDWRVMKSHVSISRQILEGGTDETICEIACRHHERLTGVGYPQGLTAEQLTLSERLVAVADVVSALAGRRSYKEPFPKDKIFRILDNEAKAGRLCTRVWNACQDNYDIIMKRAEEYANEDILLYNKMMREFTELEKELA